MHLSPRSIFEFIQKNILTENFSDHFFIFLRAETFSTYMPPLKLSHRAAVAKENNNTIMYEIDELPEEEIITGCTTPIKDNVNTPEVVCESQKTTYFSSFVNYGLRFFCGANNKVAPESTLNAETSQQNKN